MPLDLVLRDARIAGHDAPIDIGVAGGRIVEIARGIATGACETSLDGRLAFPGFVDTHIHLDKSCIMERCRGDETSVKEAVVSVAAAKTGFTEEDIYARARRTLERAIVHGTTHMRTHVEVDPRIGLKGFDAISRLKADYAWAIDLQICVFPQEGLLNDPGTEELLVAACSRGADLIGGAPYLDSDPLGQIAHIFALAERFDLDIDFHLDFDLDPSWMHLDEVARLTGKYRRGGRVAIGHATKLSALGPDDFEAAARRLAETGIAVTVLPATDLFLLGRDYPHSAPRGVTPAHRLAERGVTCSVATNNVLNPFTPYGDCSLVRMANLYANTTYAGTARELAACFDLVTTAPARLMNIEDYGIAIGAPADMVVLDAESPAAAIAALAQPLFGFKRGRATFTWPLPALQPP
jgi:cytosine/creatinine deaminase